MWCDVFPHTSLWLTLQEGVLQSASLIEYTALTSRQFVPQGGWLAACLCTRWRNSLGWYKRLLPWMLPPAVTVWGLWRQTVARHRTGLPTNISHNSWHWLLFPTASNLHTVITKHKFVRNDLIQQLPKRLINSLYSTVQETTLSWATSIHFTSSEAQFPSMLLPHLCVLFVLSVSS